MAKQKQPDPSHDRKAMAKRDDEKAITKAQAELDKQAGRRTRIQQRGRIRR